MHAEFYLKAENLKRVGNGPLDFYVSSSQLVVIVPPEENVNISTETGSSTTDDAQDVPVVVEAKTDVDANNLPNCLGQLVAQIIDALNSQGLRRKHMIADNSEDNNAPAVIIDRTPQLVLHALESS